MLKDKILWMSNNYGHFKRYKEIQTQDQSVSDYTDNKNEKGFSMDNKIYINLIFLLIVFMAFIY